MILSDHIHMPSYFLRHLLNIPSFDYAKIFLEK